MYLAAAGWVISLDQLIFKVILHYTKWRDRSLIIHLLFISFHLNAVWLLTTHCFGGCPLTFILTEDKDRSTEYIGVPPPCLEKSRANSATWSHESYMKDPEKSRADTAARSHKIYEKDLEKSHESLKWNWLGYILQK